MGGAGHYCVVHGCLNKSSKNSNLSFFMLPRDCERRRIWLMAIGRQDLLQKIVKRNSDYRVCSIHFETSMLTKKRLALNAVPTLYLPGSEETNTKDTTNSSIKVILVNQLVKPTSRSVETQTSNLTDSISSQTTHEPSISMRGKRKSSDSVNVVGEKYTDSTTAVTKVCCTCLSFDVQMLSLTDAGIRECFDKVTGIKINFEEKFLQNVCEKCVSLMRKFAEYKHKCLEANRRLRQMLTQFTYLTKDLLLKGNQELYSKTMNEFDDVQCTSNSETGKMRLSDKSISENTPGSSTSDTYIDNDEMELANSLILLKSKYDSDTEVVDDVSSILESIKAEKTDRIVKSDIDEEDLMENDTLAVEPESSQSDHILSDRIELGNIQQLVDTERYGSNTLVDNSSRSELMESKTVAEETSKLKKDAKDVVTSIKRKRLRKTLAWKTNYAVKIVLTDEQQMEELLKRKCLQSYLKADFKCYDCVLGFRSDEKFKEHMEFHDESRGDCVCDVCKLRYSNLTQLRAHQTTHRIRYKCLTCDELLKTPKQALVHRNESHDRTFQCELCYEKFQEEQLYEEHIHKAHPSPYVCDFCGYYFTSDSDLKYHGRMSKACKEKITILKCNRCDMDFDKFQPWYNHNVRHAALGKEQPPTECQVCGHETKSWFDWKEHVCREHRRINRSTAKALKKAKKRYICELCGKNVGSIHMLKVHKYRHHPDTRSGDVPFRRFKWTQTCEICDKTFLSHNMKRHMLIHTGEKPFECNVCDRAFSQAVTRDMHVRIVHEKLVHPTKLKRMNSETQSNENSNKKTHKQFKKPNAKPFNFPCSKCEKKFRNNFTLTVHERIHTGEKPFACDHCPAKFTSETYLKIHQRIHTGVKPFSCDICGMAFAQQSNLSRHMVVHTGAKNYQCDMCEKAFKQFDGLKSHRNTIHLNLPNPTRKPRKRTKKE